MGYSLELFLANFDALSNIIGSKNDSLLSEILDGQYCRDQDRESDDGKTVLRAVSEFISGAQLGRKVPAEHEHIYRYAFREICRFTCEEIELNRWVGVHYSAVQETGLKQIMKEYSHSPFPSVPCGTTDEFPVISYISNSNLKRANSLLTESGETEIVNLAEDFSECIDMAISSNCDFISFYY